jgi:hypothetical protein
MPVCRTWDNWFRLCRSFVDRKTLFGTFLMLAFSPLAGRIKHAAITLEATLGIARESQVDLGTQGNNGSVRTAHAGQERGMSKVECDRLGAKAKERRLSEELLGDADSAPVLAT